MEVKVYVDGLQRSICGVGKDTTCQDIVYALAHATGKRGRFVLVERSLRGKHEKPLAPSDPILLLLQQKGEFWHDVQFVLLQTEQSANAATSFQHSLSPLPTESPFQRSFDGKGGAMRKSLSSCRSDFSLAKPNQNSTKVSGISFPMGVVENNFATDLIATKAMKKAVSNGQMVPPLANQVLKVPIMPYGSEIPYDFNEGAPSAKISSKKGSVRNGNAHKEASQKASDKRKQFVQEIEQQSAELENTQQREYQVDKEISMWESKLALLSEEIESVENSTKKQRLSEKSVSAEIAQLLNLSLENLLQQRLEGIEAIRGEMHNIKAGIDEREADIKRTHARVQELSRELDREEAKNVQQLNSAVKAERDKVARELHQLVIIQAQQDRRLEEASLEEQRLDSTILARQLELDSLQSTLKKVNFAGFVTSSIPHATSTDTLSEFATTNAESLRSGPQQQNAVMTAVKLENRASPTPPARKTTPSQRIIVLKRNTARDPQGMWV